MPKSEAEKFYAVAVGWDSPSIYMTWHEVRHGLNSPGLSRSWLPDLVFGESQPSDSLGIFVYN